MINITIGEIPYAFVGGVLKLQYASVSFEAGEYPNNLRGSLQVSPSDGLSDTPTEEEIKKVALVKIQKLISLPPTESQTTSVASSAPVK